MRKSIVQEDRSVCFLCGRNGSGDRLEKHHIFGGPNRSFSESDGLYVYLCGDRCHRNGDMAVHRSKDTADHMHRIGQMAWEKHYKGSGTFLQRYGKNYLD